MSRLKVGRSYWDIVRHAIFEGHLELFIVQLVMLALMFMVRFYK
jgi:hypothetical protein